MIPMNLLPQEAHHLAALIGCKVSSFPIKYLGVPLHDRKLRINDSDVLVHKVIGKLSNWSGSLLSFGGRLTLINSVLSAILLYMFSLYKVPILVIQY
jgi:hypothetical protein